MRCVRLGAFGPVISTFLLAEMNAAQEFYIGTGINFPDMALRDIGDKEAEGATLFFW